MSKQLTFVYNDQEYVLEFTRRSVEMMEKQGFVADDIERKPMTVLPSLFAGAFLAHHRFTKRDVIDEIYAKLPNKMDLIGKLAEMYNEPLNALLEEPDEKSGNVNWTANW